MSKRTPLSQDAAFDQAVAALQQFIAEDVDEFKRLYGMIATGAQSEREAGTVLEAIFEAETTGGAHAGQVSRTVFRMAQIGGMLAMGRMIGRDI